MNLPFWSDEERLFVPWLLGISLNFKHVARKLGWMRPRTPKRPESVESAPAATRTREDRLRDAVERSRFERR